jgi:hypothetical protein
MSKVFTITEGLENLGALKNRGTRLSLQRQAHGAYPERH